MHKILPFLQFHEYLATWAQCLAALIAVPSAIFAFWKVFADIKTERGKIDAIGQLLKHQKELRRKDIQPAWVFAPGVISRNDKTFQINLKNTGHKAYFDKIEYDKTAGISTILPKADKLIDKDKEIHFSFTAQTMETANYPPFEFYMYYRDEDFNRYRVRIHTSNRGTELDIPEYITVSSNQER